MDSKKKIILIVDDTSENIDVLSGILSSEYTIKAAMNGERALKIAASEGKPDLILLDIMMPEMDGYEVCRRLKASEESKDIPVIFVTAKGETTDETLGFEVGAVDYITKPISPPIVSARVKNIITLQESQNEVKEALDKTLTGSIELMADVLAQANPLAFGRSRNLKRHVSATAKRLGHQNSWTFEIAAMLSQLGCITVPEEILEKIYNGEAVSEDEQKLFDNHPLVAKRLLEKIPKLEKAAEIISLQNIVLDELDNETESDSQIHLGASLLQIALHMDDIDRKRHASAHTSTDKVITAQEDVADTDTGTSSQGDQEQELPLSELRTGMMLSAQVITANGSVLIKAGTEITQPILERLYGFHNARRLKQDACYKVAISS